MAVPPTGPSSGSSGAANEPSMPIMIFDPKIALPASNPFVRFVKILFPGVGDQDAQMYAARLQSNMFQMLNDQIKKDQEKAKEAARKFKESIEGND